MTPAPLRVLDMRRFAQLVMAQGMQELDEAGAQWPVNLMTSQDRTLVSAAWKETMAFESRPRLAAIACPTLVVAGARDRAVPLHHARMLHAGIQGAQLVVIVGAGHSLI
jgi:pimeloyl-ACP methyl ester carboxylesterase